ncbi:MAG: ABC transporter permease [Spirochaetaceae bacterium]|nr:ABC transporter permease [Spirochaetaceae bacterium]
MSFIYLTGNMLDWASILLCAAIGFSICRAAGLFNMGIEGQMYAGGFASAACFPFFSAFLPEGPVFTVLGAAAAAAGAGALLGFLCGFLKKICGANELITTFLLSAAVFPVIGYLIGGPFRGVEGSLLATAKLPDSVRFARILPPSNLNVSVFASIVLLFCCRFFVNETAPGYRMRLCAEAGAFAAYAGIGGGGARKNYWLYALSFSGALAGLAGFFAVYGSAGLCHQGFTGGVGWAAITTSLIARGKFAALVPAALFYSLLKFSADAALLGLGESSYFFTFVTGCALFFSARESRAK